MPSLRIGAIVAGGLLPGVLEWESDSGPYDEASQEEQAVGVPASFEGWNRQVTMSRDKENRDMAGRFKAQHERDERKRLERQAAKQATGKPAKRGERRP